MNAMIETHDLRHTFKTPQGAIEAVAGVDLSVEAGTIFGFLGPNGAGKTTTLRMLTTLLPPTGGEAVVAGCDLRRQPRELRLRIGYVGQRGGTDAQVTGRRELLFQCRLHRMGAGHARRRAAELIDLFELDDCADRPTGGYSGGQRRRLDIAIGLVHRPPVLFLDEPTTGLDPQSRAHLWDELRTLCSAGTTVFITTHYLEEADALCDNLAIIDHGRIVAEGTPEQLKRRIACDVVTLGMARDQATPAFDVLQGQPFVRQAGTEHGTVRLYVDAGEAAIPAILRVLDGAGLDPQTIALSRPSLDDVFLRQTGRSLRERGGS